MSIKKNKIQELRCAYVVVIMGIYWMFEVMPLAATALMPTFLFPVLGVLSSKATCMSYLTVGGLNKKLN